jgi:hypothetical protein
LEVKAATTVTRGLDAVEELMTLSKFAQRHE